MVKARDQERADFNMFGLQEYFFPPFPYSGNSTMGLLWAKSCFLLSLLGLAVAEKYLLHGLVDTVEAGEWAEWRKQHRYIYVMYTHIYMHCRV